MKCLYWVVTPSGPYGPFTSRTKAIKSAQTNLQINPHRSRKDLTIVAVDCREVDWIAKDG